MTRTPPVRCAACNRPVLPRDEREARMMRVRGVEWRCARCVEAARKRLRRLARMPERLGTRARDGV